MCRLLGGEGLVGFFIFEFFLGEGKDWIGVLGGR